MRRKRKPQRREVYSQTTSLDDGSQVTVWLAGDLDEVNGVLRNLPATDPKTLHVIPLPAGISPGEEFLPPDARTVDTGYDCPQCKHRVQGGTGEKPYLHRFDFCGCLVALRHVESNRNQILTASDGWNLCLQSVRSARRAADADNGTKL